MRLRLIVTIILATIKLAFSQDDGRQILSDMNRYWQQIRDYSVDMHISADIPGLKIPDKKVRFYYKEPGLTKIESRGFALVPKEAVLFKPGRFLKENFQVEILKDSLKKLDKLLLLKVIPPEGEHKPILFLQIDTTRKVITRLYSDPVEDNQLEIQISYQRIDNFWLPDTTRFQFQFNKDFQEIFSSSKDRRHSGKLKRTPRAGNILITFQNYHLNQGLSDDFFNKDK